MSLMSLLIRKQTGSEGTSQRGQDLWHIPAVTKYPDESSLQTIIAESPSILPGVPDGGVFTVTELGFVDVLCISLSGELTICECKLRTNPEIRREIVGQLMAYAALLWQTPYEDLDRQIALHQKDGEPLVERMRRLAQDVNQSDWNGDDFRYAVNANLAKGCFRLVFAVDEITEELKHIVEFLNAHTSEGLLVLATEIGYVQDCGVEILSPAVYGEEANKDVSRTRKWDRQSFLAELSSQAPNAVPGIEALMRWAVREEAREVYGTGKKWGSWYPVWHGRTMRDAPIAVWTYGSLCINLPYFRRLPSFEQGTFLIELQQRLDEFSITLGPERDYPSVDCSALQEQATQERFFDVVHWLREQFYPPTRISESELEAENRAEPPTPEG